MRLESSYKQKAQPRESVWLQGQFSDAKEWAVLKAPHDLDGRDSRERNEGGLSMYVSQESYKLVRIAIFTI